MSVLIEGVDTAKQLRMVEALGTISDARDAAHANWGFSKVSL